MKITPIEIRQKIFEKKAFGGYDKEEVTAFLQALSQEWEKINNELRENKLKLELAEKEVKQLRQMESSLFITLKTAEDTGSNMVEQARKDAELKVKEAQLKADEILGDARTQAKNLLQKTEIKSKSLLQQSIAEAKRMKQDCTMLEDYKDNMIAEIKNVAYSMLDKANRSESKNNLDNFDKAIEEAEEEIETNLPTAESRDLDIETIKVEKPNVSPNNLASFFDTVI